MNNIKNFFKIVGFEIKRLIRNKVVFSTLLLLPIVILILYSSVNFSSPTYKFAVMKSSSVSNTDESSIEEFVNNNITSKNVVEVSTFNEGINLVKTGKIKFFIYYDVDSKPESVTIYYDETSYFSRFIINYLNSEKDKYAYDSVKEYFEDYGITLDDAYFHTVNFEGTSKDKLDEKQMPYTLMLGSCTAFILMFGLAYSISRDNETNVSRNINYTPIGTNRYLLSKISPYILIAVFESIIIYFIGKYIFDINYAVNFMIVFAIFMVFSLATIMIGLICSMLKSQIATSLLATFIIILPLFISVNSYIENLPLFLQVIMYILPLTSFISLYSGAVFNGVIIWWAFIALIIQIIAYYIISLLILKNKSNS